MLCFAVCPKGQAAENSQAVEKLRVILYIFIWFTSVLFPRLQQQPPHEKLLFLIHNRAVSKWISQQQTVFGQRGGCEAAWQMCHTAAACTCCGPVRFGKGKKTRVAKSKALQRLMECYRRDLDWDRSCPLLGVTAVLHHAWKSHCACISSERDDHWQ